MLSAATMGRLRTAARSFAELDFPGRGAHPPRQPGGPPGPGGPRRRRDRHRRRGPACTPSTTRPPSGAPWPAPGTPPPALVRPDGTVSFPRAAGRASARPGGLPFEAVEIDLPEGQPAGPLHRRPHRGPGPRRRQGSSTGCARPWPCRSASPRRPARWS
ncbi:hypothetical protein LT493_12585 [Streptomyces tricolor]|nr:hypothetical protein [Streptomyces tricolor]